MKNCKQCGQPMASEAPQGLCARCLLSQVLKEPEPPSGGPAPSTPANPSVTGGGDIPDIGDASEVARRLPQFEIMEMLGRGGMGVVYKARQLQLDRLVALKILPPVDALTPDFVERFRREARSLAKLSHPNIVNVHDFGESGGLYFFVMEFVYGVNLREMIRSGKMKAEEALAVVPKICDALQFAHEEGVVHRDIKPENILVDKRGRVKIADFGLAKLLRREQTDHTLTMSGMTLGTPRYMAPEQLDKPETVDHRADIYSLGVVFYEMLTGEVPMGRFAPPSQKVQIDVRLDEIVLHALERDADRRYQRASELGTDVENVTRKPQVAPSAKAGVTPAANPGDENAEDEVEVVEHPVFARIWKFFALGVVLLVFITIFSPWGGKVWPFFGVGVAVLAIASGLFSTIKTKKAGGTGSSADGTRGQSALAAKLRTHWGTCCALLLLALSIASVLVPSSITAWLGISAYVTAIPVAGGDDLSFAPRTAFEAGTELWQGQVIAAACAIALVMVANAFVSRKKFAGALAMIVAGAMAIGLSAHFLATYREWHFAAAGISWHDLQAIAQGHSHDDEHVGTNMFIVEHPTFVPPLAALWDDVKTRAAKLPPGSVEALAIAKGSSSVQVHHIEQPGAKWTLFLGVCVLLFGIAGVLQSSAQITGSENEPSAENVASEPRLSRCALFGAIWVSFGIPAAAVLGLAIYDVKGGPLGGILHLPVWLWAAVAISAPFGTTILGGIAIAQIKRSSGKLYGLRLAAVAALCYPLLLAGVLGAAITMFAWGALGFDKPGQAHAPVPEALSALAVVIFGAMAAWRKISGAKNAPVPTGELESQEIARAERLNIAVRIVVILGIAAASKWQTRPHSDVPGLDQAFEWINYLASLAPLMACALLFNDSWRRHARWIIVSMLLVIVWRGAALSQSARSSAPVAGSLAATEVRKVDAAVTYLEGHTSVVKAVAVSPDGRTLVSAGLDGRVIVRDFPDEKVRRIAFDSSHPNSKPLAQFWCAAISPDSQRVVVGAGSGAQLYNIHLDKNQTEMINVPNERNATIRYLKFSDNGNKVA